MEKRKGCLKGCLIVLASIIGIFFLLIIITVVVPEPKEKIYENAQNLYKKQNFEEALTLIERAIKKDSLNPNYHFLKAKITYELKDSITSMDALSKSQSILKGDSIKYEFTKGIIDWRLQKKDTIEAVKLLEDLRTLFGDQDFAKYSASHYYFSDKMYSLGKGEESLKAMRLFLSSLEDLKMDTLTYQSTYYEVSNKFLKYGYDKEFVEILRSLIKEIPKSKKAYEELGLYYLNENSNREALGYLKKYVELDTINIKVYGKIGKCYMALGQKSKAKNYLKIAADKGDNEACKDLRELTAKIKYYVQSRCCDGTTSNSTGRGACSHHRGICRIEHIPYKEYTMSCN